MESKSLIEVPARPGRVLLMILSVCVAMLGWTLLLLTPALAAGQAVAELSLNPAAASIFISDTVTVSIIVSDVVDLYGAEIALAFDPGMVAVVDDNPGFAGVQIAPGSCPVANFVAQNSADNVSGVVNYAVTSLAPAAPCSGTGTIASITFLGLAPGISPISFTTWLLSDSSIQSITTTATSGSVMVELRPGMVRGAVTLQGRADYSGVSIEVWNSDGWPTSPLTNTLTGSDGAYALTLPTGSYSVTMEMDSYLDAQRTNVVVDADGVIDLPGLELPCGDPNDDDLINVQDLTMLGSRYRLICGDPGWDGRADMINDCVINILDLTCSGVNYGRTSPVDWP